MIQNLKNDMTSDCGQASDSITFIQFNTVYKSDQTAIKRWHRACETAIVVHTGRIGSEITHNSDMIISVVG